MNGVWFLTFLIFIQVKVPRQESIETTQASRHHNFEEEIENRIDALDNLQNLETPNEYLNRATLRKASIDNPSSTGNIGLSTPLNENRSHENNYTRPNGTSGYGMFVQSNDEINIWMNLWYFQF